MISGFGKTRLNSASAYASTLVTIIEAVGSTGSVLFTPDVGNGRLVEVSEVGLRLTTLLSELGDVSALVGKPCTDEIVVLPVIEVSVDIAEPELLVRSTLYPAVSACAMQASLR